VDTHTVGQPTNSIKALTVIERLVVAVSCYGWLLTFYGIAAVVKIDAAG